MELKYVMFKVKYGKSVTRYFPVIFGMLEVHKQIADEVSNIKVGSEKVWAKPVPVSAGYVSFCAMSVKNPFGVDCWGDSESLGIAFHKSDAEIIGTLSYLHGIGFAERGEVKPGVEDKPESTKTVV